MPVVDVHLRVRHPCPYCDLSAAFPRCLFLLWGENRRDVLLLSTYAPQALTGVLDAVTEAFHAEVLLRDGSEALVSLRDYEWDDPPAVPKLAEKEGLWVLPPTFYFAGKETYRLIGPSAAGLRRLTDRLRRLGEVELLSVRSDVPLAEVRDVPTANVHFFEGLTDRQAAVLVAALDHGLLDVPARGRWDEAARQLGLSRSTFGEHLRKGQGRVLRNSYAALRARAEQSGPPQLLGSTGPPAESGPGPLVGTRGARFPPEEPAGAVDSPAWTISATLGRPSRARRSR